ncbi:[Protein-PII] uridylyltransferase [Salix suchowensis]|nr:[Protein-PII] uridylyltransferase [Salix suchowensis]
MKIQNLLLCVMALLEFFMIIQFSSTVQASATCEPYLFYHDEVMEDGVQKFTWSEFCTILHQVSWEALSVFPDYKLGGSYLEDRKLASVLFGKDNELILQHVQCSQATTNDSHGAEVSAVLRVIPAETDPSLARTLTGLSALVFNAEGRWDPSTGKLCMLGCRPGDDSELKRCTLRISLYFPRALSIKQRSLVFGSISNIRDEASSNYHLLFDLAMQPSYLKYQLYSYNLSYKYSKLSLLLPLKSEPAFPALKGAESRAQLDSLSDDLLIDGFIALMVLSLGPLIRHFQEDGSEKSAVNTAANVAFTSRQLLNVSAHLIFRELKGETQEFTMISYRNISQVFLEGIYDPVIGEMHLIGCRKVVVGGTGQDDPLYFGPVSLLANKTPYQDYSLNQTGQDDPLYFGPVSLPRYQNHTLTVANRRTYEGILRILLLSGVIAMTWIQLHYMKKQTNVIPYVSIVMIALQFLGYSLPLLCGSEILFTSSSYDPDWCGLLPKSSTMLEGFLFWFIWMKHRWVPRNKLVLLSTLAVHTGVLIWLSVYEHPDMLFHPENGYKTSAIHLQQIWMSILKDLTGVVQDFFLLPQIISNFLLQSNVKSLQKAHYMGLTLIRLVLHLYEYISNPFLDSNFQDSKFVNPESTSEFRKSAAVIIMVVLAVIVHIQQNWKKLSQWLEL